VLAHSDSRIVDSFQLARSDLLIAPSSAFAMHQPGGPFYCRWCGKSWPTRPRLNRHYAQAQLCATLRWNHFSNVVKKAQTEAELTLAIPAAAHAPRQPPEPSHAGQDGAARTPELLPPIPTRGNNTADDNAPAVDAPRSDLPAADNMGWEPERSNVTGLEDGAVRNEGGEQRDATAFEPVSEGGWY
jgi:hypothetical protein